MFSVKQTTHSFLVSEKQTSRLGSVVIPGQGRNTKLESRSEWIQSIGSTYTDRVIESCYKTKNERAT